MRNRLIYPHLLVLLVLFADQVSKLLVHYLMELGPAGQVTVFDDWFHLYYVLNPGMAFGIELDFAYGKLVLTLSRIVVALAMGWFLWAQARAGKVSRGFLIGIALILGGTLGNLIDSIFYGVFLQGNVTEEAITPWFHGRVIDMLYFPMYEDYLPTWVPFWGGSYFIFFSPVFNLADTSIFIGVSNILLFQRRSLRVLENSF